MNLFLIGVAAAPSPRRSSLPEPILEIGSYQGQSKHDLSPTCETCFRIAGIRAWTCGPVWVSTSSRTSKNCRIRTARSAASWQ